MDTQNQIFEITPDNLQSLERLLRTQFLDICKIIELFDGKKAQEFKKMNTAYLTEHQNKHGDHDNHGHGCSHSASGAIYIPIEK